MNYTNFRCLVEHKIFQSPKYFNLNLFFVCELQKIKILFFVCENCDRELGFWIQLAQTPS